MIFTPRHIFFLIFMTWMKAAGISFRKGIFFQLAWNKNKQQQVKGTAGQTWQKLPLRGA